MHQRGAALQFFQLLALRRLAEAQAEIAHAAACASAGAVIQPPPSTRLPSG